MANTIMLQSTCSSAGKSLIATALCRIFKQDGFCVAPFKSQTFTQNYYTTKNNLVMSATQAMQALASGLEPVVTMNPVFLHSTNHSTINVYLHGKLLGEMSSFEFTKLKKELAPEVTQSFNALLSENDIVVIEGSGSPVEINLNENDIANMGMAKIAKSPVLIIGDIELGGVFASLYGTIKLLNDDEIEYVKGTIINKFRGNNFNTGITALEAITEKPVIGVIPYCDFEIDVLKIFNDNQSEQKFDRLADTVRQSLNIKKIYEITKNGL